MNTERDNLHSNRPAPKLSDTQLILLSAAAQRDDLCLTPRPNLKGGVAHKVAEKLIAAGFAEEVLAKAGGYLSCVYAYSNSGADDERRRIGRRGCRALLSPSGSAAAREIFYACGDDFG
jgi:hypothetical protein